MSEDDDEITNAMSDSDRLDAELRQLAWAFLLVVIGFSILVGSACYIFINLKGG